MMIQSSRTNDHNKLPEKKGRASPPMWYIANNELDALPSYMKQRLTLDKVNAAINDMATYADANAQIIMAPRKKLSENMLDRALELREISWNNVVKGKHFFLEADIKGPALKLDNTGKATLTVLRHLGRISESRIGHHRVIILLKPQ
ncbi:spindle and kinetochore-associated protein 1 homolog isoform X2 [Olea europaea var. sylvestris]|uniref:spindle and kinetochore-associated protein 1 homolog isoform X2 n=1 Tax=Olea europaea var. sylvestris TaxID=158386 RepID=UPI000C1CF17A|nr:spindle and kinetochore-associated protein 1 homolog isoform X2 [Olea europaea var. sylvestris]